MQNPLERLEIEVEHWQLIAYVPFVLKMDTEVQIE
jgi:hypothetical protein